MLYRAEIVSQGVVKASKNFPDNNPKTRVTQPRQALRRILDAAKSSGNVPDKFAIYIMNEEGQVWIYAINKEGDSFKANSVGKKMQFVNKNSVQMIMMGNQSIKESVQ